MGRGSSGLSVSVRCRAPSKPPLPHADAVTVLAVRREVAATGDRDRYVPGWRLN